MNTRIRYIKKDNYLTSKECYIIRGSKYAVQINTELMSYHIVKLNADVNMDVSVGIGKTINQLKINAKKALIDLGLEFKTEHRMPRVK